MRLIRLMAISMALIITVTAVAGAGEVRSTGMGDQAALEVTVYNVNLGLVKDRRALALPPGEQSLAFMDVAARVIPQSVSIRSLAGGGGLRVLEQNYEYDLLSPRKLLEKYVGRKIKIYYRNPYTENEEVTEATVLSTNEGVVLRVGDEITFNYEGRMIFPSVPANLISRPTLVWLLDNAVGGAQELEATYLTEGISWLADYVLTLEGDDARADLEGWVTIDNKSGAAYRDASLKLVAGDVQRLQRMDAGRFAVMAEAPAGRAGFVQEGFFEYHLYTLQRRTTIKDNQTKQIRLLSAGGVPVRKEFVFVGQQYYFRQRLGEVPRQKVGVFVEFENRAGHGLGMPLPAGTVRLYKRDSAGSLQFAGEDRIEHTPKDEKVRIKAGEAFDVVAQRRQTEWSKLGSGTYETAFEIELRNHKEEDVTVRVIEPIPGDWEMLSASHPHEKTEAFAAEFRLRVPKDGKAVLTYRVRVRH